MVAGDDEVVASEVQPPDGGRHEGEELLVMPSDPGDALEPGGARVTDPQPLPVSVGEPVDEAIDVSAWVLGDELAEDELAAGGVDEPLMHERGP
jgi:hypothetical protein